MIPSPAVLARPMVGVADFYPSGAQQCTYWPWLDPPLTTAARLAVYRRWIRNGWFPDLRAAHAHDWRLYREWTVRERRNGRALYVARMNGKAMRGYHFHRSLVFAWPRRCAYCGGPSYNVDHVVPRAQGGAEHFDNFAPACRRCNESKGDRTPGQWLAHLAVTGQSWPLPGAVYCPSP